MHKRKVFYGSRGSAWAYIGLAVIAIGGVFVLYPGVESVLVLGSLFGGSFGYIGFLILGTKVEVSDHGVTKGCYFNWEEFAFTWDQIGEWRVQSTAWFHVHTEARFDVPSLKKTVVVNDCDTGYSHFGAFVAMVREHAGGREITS